MKRVTKIIRNYIAPRLLMLPIMVCVSCSFDYGDQETNDRNQPDIVMENVEYVRVRAADPQARFQAEMVERYEERQLMKLRNFSFEQFGNRGEDVNASGRAGSGSVEIDTMDIRLDDGVRLDIDSEDIAIETSWLEWKDTPKTLTSGETNEVNIYQENGTSFTGVGFYADARRRTWEFAGAVSGTYVHDDDDEEEAGEENTVTEEGAVIEENAENTAEPPDEESAASIEAKEKM